MAMSDIPPSEIEQLRLALLDDVRVVAETLHSISDQIENELDEPAPNLLPLHIRFLSLTRTIETRTRLHARLGCPGERIATWMLTFGDSEEWGLALEILAHYRRRLARLLANAPESEKPPLRKSVQLLADFLHISHIDPESTIAVRRADSSER